MVSSGGGDPPCICSGFVSSRAIEGCATPRFWGGLRLVAAGRRFAAGRVFALVWRVPVVRRLEVARRFAVFRCFAGVRRFTGFRFFRDKRDVAARFFASPLSAPVAAGTLTKKICLQRGDCEPRD